MFFQRKVRTGRLLLALIMIGILLLALTAGYAREPQFTGASDAVSFAYGLIGHLNYEEAKVLFVDEGGNLLKVASVTQKLRSGIYYIPWELALGGRAPDGTAKVFMIHNHPGGNPELSEADVELGSFWASKAAEQGISLDLIALTRTGEYTSLRESGQLRPAPQGIEAIWQYAGYVLQPGAGMVGARVGEALERLLGTENGR